MGGRADLWLGACPRVSRLLRAVFGRSVCRARTRRSQSTTRKQTISHAGAPPTPLILLVLRPPVVGLYTYINFRLTSPIHRPPPHLTPLTHQPESVYAVVWGLEAGNLAMDLLA